MIDKRIDAYIAKSADFAKPILNHFRMLVHKAFPEIEENIKWGVPSFEYNGNVCSMAAFKEHCAFGFWKAPLMSDPHQLFIKTANEAFGHLGQIRSLKDLPSDKIIIQYVKESVKLNKDNVKLVKAKSPEKKELNVPDDLIKALKKNKTAFKIFEEFSYSNKKDYAEWIDEAKTESTKIKRIATAVEWIAEGKSRNWKYKK